MSALLHRTLSPFRRILPMLCFCFVCLSCCSESLSQQQTTANNPERNVRRDGSPAIGKSEAQVQAFVSKFCLDCHGSEKPEADFRVDSMVGKASSDNLHAWTEVLGRLEAGDMPPKKHPKQPSVQERSEAADRLRAVIVDAERRMAGTSKMPIRRLNRQEYTNTIRDLLGIEWSPVNDFPIDDSFHGFDTVAEGLQLPAALLEKYLEVALEAVDRTIRTEDKSELRNWTWCFESDLDRYPKANGIGLYNGNAHMVFAGRMVYIGGPALFGDVHLHPTVRQIHEGQYRIHVKMTPHRFDEGAVASFSIDGMGKIVSKPEFKIQNGTPVEFDAEAYFDRSQSLMHWELNWTNGHHLQWIRRGARDQDEQFRKYWSLVNYRFVDGKPIEWRPTTLEELPFGYFDDVSVTLSGPHYEQWPPRSTSQLIGDYLQTTDPLPVFQAFLPKAFRRNVTEAEVMRYAQWVKTEQARGQSPIAAIKSGLAAALASPDFVLLVDRVRQTPGRDELRIDDYSLASRLSYFLWSSMPDDELLLSASKGKLHEREELAHQFSRMCRDPKAEAFITRFSNQWLGMQKLDSVMPEPKLFPFYDEALRNAMREETVESFRDVFHNNRSLLELIDPDWTYVNEKLADHYGIPGINGDSMKRIHLTDKRRGGVLAQAAVLTFTSEATRTSPVLRGKWVLDRVFHRPPPPPPPNIAGLMPDVSEAKTAREQLALHKSVANCAGCHTKFDPFGIAMENFDAIGAWRETESSWHDPASPSAANAPTRSFPIDASAVLPDGTMFDGITGLKALVRNRKEEFAAGFVEQLMIYSLGRGLRMEDQSEVQSIVKKSSAKNFTLQDLMLEVVCSNSFQRK